MVRSSDRSTKSGCILLGSGYGRDREDESVAAATRAARDEDEDDDDTPATTRANSFVRRSSLPPPDVPVMVGCTAGLTVSRVSRGLALLSSLAGDAMKTRAGRGAVILSTLWRYSMRGGKCSLGTRALTAIWGRGIEVRLD